MDLSSLDTSAQASKGATLELRDPMTDSVLRDEDSGEAVTLTLIGSDAKSYQQAAHKSLNRRLNKKITKAGRLKLSAEELEDDAFALLLISTTGWSHVIVDGNELQFSEINARMVYERFPWIREQADEFINDRMNFLGNSSTASTSMPKSSSRK